jgi:hypothetical protein
MGSRKAFFKASYFFKKGLNPDKRLFFRIFLFCMDMVKFVNNGVYTTAKVWHFTFFNKSAAENGVTFWFTTCKAA